MIYAYAICDQAVADPPPDGVGLSGARLRAVKSDGLGAVYSRHRTRFGRPSMKLVLKHQRVVEQVMTSGPVLPLRFGMQLESERQLVRELVERREELLCALDRVRGHVELGVRVIPRRDRETNDEPETLSGRDYLLARVGDHAHSRILQRELHAPLARLATAEVLRTRAAPPAIMVAAYLVDAAAVAEFRRRAKELSERQTNAHVLVTGPWPPYSFAAEASR
jgi:Gas vesicle synthesis protein GvpL/GvpF